MGRKARFIEKIRLHSKRIFFLAGLAEMNIRRVIERKTQSRSSNNALYLYVPRTFESENKGWPK